MHANDIFNTHLKFCIHFDVAESNSVTKSHSVTYNKRHSLKKLNARKGMFWFDWFACVIIYENQLSIPVASLKVDCLRLPCLRCLVKYHLKNTSLVENVRVAHSTERCLMPEKSPKVFSILVQGIVCSSHLLVSWGFFHEREKSLFELVAKKENGLFLKLFSLWSSNIRERRTILFLTLCRSTPFNSHEREQEKMPSIDQHWNNMFHVFESKVTH